LAAPEQETIQRGFRPLSHGRTQWEYFRLRFLHVLWSCSPHLRHLSFQRLSQWTLTGPGRARSHTPVSGAELPDTSCEYPVASDVQHMDILNEVVCQLGDDLLDELFARISTSASLPAESVDGDETEPAGFPHSAE
jgi:hypothetical protein